jgi:RIO-like serine/threonine protein kinase
MSPKVENKIVSAFDAIHGLQVVHGDIRSANILIGKDDKVWVIDFEFGHTVTEGDAGDEALSNERTAVQGLLHYLRKDIDNDLQTRGFKD